MANDARWPSDTGELPHKRRAADLINVLTLLDGKLATGEILEDAMVTFSDSFFMVRPVGPDPHIRIVFT